jgi:hypothetical protein
MEKPYLFLSHSGEDRILAVQLAQTIRQAFNQQIDVFNTSEPQYRMTKYDDLNNFIQIGSDWRKGILRWSEILGKELTSKIENSVGILLLVTPQSIELHSQWIDLEIKAGTTLASKKGYPFFFPIVAGGATLRQLPGKAREFQGIDLSDKESFNELLMILSNTHDFTLNL